MAHFYFEESTESFSQMAYQTQSGHGWEPPMDVFETNDAYTVRLEIPGVDKHDLRLSFQDDTLTIRGERQREQDSPNLAILRMEIEFGEFRREVRFPEKVQREAVKANYQEGFLKVVLPKL